MINKNQWWLWILDRWFASAVGSVSAASSVAHQRRGAVVGRMRHRRRLRLDYGTIRILAGSLRFHHRARRPTGSAGQKLLPPSDRSRYPVSPCRSHPPGYQGTKSLINQTNFIARSCTIVVLDKDSVIEGRDFWLVSIVGTTGREYPCWLEDAVSEADRLRLGWLSER